LSEFLILPEAFVQYVNQHKKIPIPSDASLETFKDLFEIASLEASLAIAEDTSHQNLRTRLR